MESWESINKTLAFIEENLAEKLEMDSLARKANLSSFYYQRLFRRLVGKPVMEYVKLRRLANSAEALLAKDRILDVALTVGFDNHETFTRAFKEAYGLTPDAYRKNPRPLSHFLKPDLAMQYHLIDEEVPLVADGIILEVSRKELSYNRYFAGLSIDTDFSDNPGIDFLAELWHAFHRKKHMIDNLKQNGNEIGVGSPGEQEGQLKYFVGSEIEDNLQSKEFTNWSMPAGNYIVCSFEAENFHLLTTDALDKAVKYMYGTWLTRKKITPEPFMAELYFDTSPEGVSMEIWFKIA